MVVGSEIASALAFFRGGRSISLGTGVGIPKFRYMLGANAGSC